MDYDSRRVPRRYLPDTFVLSSWFIGFADSADDFPTPEVKHLQKWFPGAESKLYAEEGRRMSDLVVDDPLECVKEWLKVSP